MNRRIAFQGEAGAYSHQACRQARPDLEPLPCTTFEDAIRAVRSGEAVCAALPVENSTYGRVADIHQLIPDSDLFVVDEAFVRIRINLLAVPEATLESVERVYSHTVLLGQCRRFLKSHGYLATGWVDTAGAAKRIAERGGPGEAALASELAGEIHGLQTLASGVEDHQFNRTRFFIMAGEMDASRRGDSMITSFMFEVRNLPAALYKAMGGFATNQVNMIKLESYMVRGSFKATQFFAEIEGHPEDEAVKRAFEELDFFTEAFKLLGIYPAAPERS